MKITRKPIRMAKQPSKFVYRTKSKPLRLSRRDIEAQRRQEQRIADRIDGYDRDDLGESPDF